MLAPLSLMGLPLATSKVFLVVIYCSPLALLILILLLNRNMKIFTKENIKFYVTEIMGVGLIITFIFIDNKAKSYFLLCFMIACCLGVLCEALYLTYSGFDISNVKVHPEPEYEERPKKRIYNEEEEKNSEGYF